MPPCTMPNSVWSGRLCAARQRRAQLADRSTAFATNAFSDGYGVHWSSCMAMSAPSCSWMAMLLSGVQRTFAPS